MDANSESRKLNFWIPLCISMAGVASFGVVLFLLLYDRHFLGTNDPIETQPLIWSTLPSGLFFVALRAAMRSSTMQQVVAISAGLVGVLFVGGSLLAVSSGLGHGTGMGGEAFVVLAWIIGIALSVTVLLLAMANNAWRGFRDKPSRPTGDSGSK